jgi:hypothetical protein
MAYYAPRAATAGGRDHLVTIERRVSVTSGYPVTTWTRLGQQYMQRDDRASDERFVAAQESAYQYTVWSMPYLASMDPETVDVPATRRLVSKGRTYDIRSATRRNRNTIELVTLVGTTVQ